ncbi:MAG: TonB-dependent receptor [Bacteroidales bacterium]|nr:TonB-dependent receptor [Bacteroidales bacterium]
MYKKIFFALGLALLMTGYTFAQNATLKGKVTDQDGKPVDFATVRLMQEDAMILGTTTDEKGNYTLKPIPTGKFDLLVTFMGCRPYKREGIPFSGSTVKFQDVQIDCKSGKTLDPVVIKDVKPIFNVDDPSQQAMTSDELENVSGKSISSALNTMSGLTSSGGGTSVRGNRTGQLVYMVDGVRSGNDVPFSSVASMNMISGGIPAKYGDGAAFVEIETKGAARHFGGSIDLYDYINGYYSGGMQFSLTGPILKKLEKRTDSLMKLDQRKSKLNSAGFYLSGSLNYNPGSTSLKGGYYEAPQSLIDELKANPLRIEEDGVNYNNTLYITKDQWGKSKKRLSNATSYGGNLFGKLDIRTTNIDVIATGKFSYSAGQNYTFANSLYNTENNGFSESWTGAAMLRLTQRFHSDTSSIFKNAFYRIQFSYEHGAGKSYSKTHKENIFDYGYIGKLEHRVMPYYEYGTDSLNGRKLDNVYKMTSFAYVIDTFIPGDKNPDLARYTENVFDMFGTRIQYDNHIQSLGGLLNGEAPSGAAYGFFSAPGVAYNGVGRSLSDVLDFNANLSFDIKNHGIEMGFQYYQSMSHSFSVSPRGLWTLMRTLANDHINELDENSAYGTYDNNGVFTDTVNYKRLINKEGQKTFDKNLREKLGAAEDEWIDIDRYDPETYSLDMFSAEELFNNGNAYVSYYGYDYTGKHPNNKAITMDDMQKWFNGEDGRRDFTSIGAYKPIYMAGYIQDHFAIKTLYFNVGVRLDVNDANQPVVKDMYLYREAYTAKEVNQMNVTFTDKNYKIPASIGDDYTVYVQDPTAAEMEVTAYRSGTTWYDPQGNEVTDPTDLAQEANVSSLTPYLKEMPGASDQTKVSYKAFQDYTPTLESGGISIAPRLSFSFSVNDASVFYAHYNVMTKRQNSRLNPVYYLFFEDYAKNGSYCANTGLKPEKSIDYEVGFRQKLGDNMALNLSAYYSEKRDQVQVYRYTEAYPATYYSYTNIDFGTTQGFTIGLEMRKVKHVSFSTNYTLQFAKGTGSSSTSAANIIAAGQPNLRTLTTLSFDQRHVLNANINLSCGHGEGGTFYLNKKEIHPLENSGMNITAKAGSGLPYTRSSTISSLNGQGASQLVGSIYGSRMPWQYSCNMKFYKYWQLKLKDSDDKRGQKKAMLQAYLDINNIFNFSNVTSVYRYTGNASDDGFLTAEEFQKYISQQTCPESFIDYYTYIMTAGRLGSARVITLGAMLNF